MGRVSAFLGMVLYMYPEKTVATIDRMSMFCVEMRNECFLSLKVRLLVGEMPGRQLRNVQTFIDMRTEELMLNWKLCIEGKEVADPAASFGGVNLWPCPPDWDRRPPTNPLSICSHRQVGEFSFSNKER